MGAGIRRSESQERLPVKKTIENLLKNNIVEGAAPNHQKAWNVLRPMKIEDLQTFWDKVEFQTGSPMIDQMRTYYDEWTDGGFKYWGMRRQDNGNIEGIIRQYSPNGGIRIYTAKDGKCHGFYLWIMEKTSTYCIGLYKKGKRIAHLFFDSNF